MAAPLESSSSASSSSKSQAPTTDNKKDAPPKKLNQVVGLLDALLAIGSLRLAVAILSKYPWMVDVHPEVADLLLRILSHSISPLYDTVVVTKERPPSFAQMKPKYAGNGHFSSPTRKSNLTLWAPPPPSTINTSFTFFYPDWQDFIPVCSSLDDLVDVIEPLMRFIGLHVSREPMFITKFMRLARVHLAPTVCPTRVHNRNQI